MGNGKGEGMRSEGQEQERKEGKGRGVLWSPKMLKIDPVSAGYFIFHGTTS